MEKGTCRIAQIILLSTLVILATSLVHQESYARWGSYTYNSGCCQIQQPQSSSQSAQSSGQVQTSGQNQNQPVYVGQSYQVRTGEKITLSSGQTATVQSYYGPRYTNGAILPRNREVYQSYNHFATPDARLAPAIKQKADGTAAPTAPSAAAAKTTAQTTVSVPSVNPQALADAKKRLSEPGAIERAQTQYGLDHGMPTIDRHIRAEMDPQQQLDARARALVELEALYPTQNKLLTATQFTQQQELQTQRQAFEAQLAQARAATEAATAERAKLADELYAARLALTNSGAVHLQKETFIDTRTGQPVFTLWRQMDSSTKALIGEDFKWSEGAYSLWSADGKTKITEGTVTLPPIAHLQFVRTWAQYDPEKGGFSGSFQMRPGSYDYQMQALVGYLQKTIVNGDRLQFVEK